jgi:hypothetical protein
VNKHGVLIATAFFLVLTLRASAQVSVGENLNMNLDGNIFSGYSGDYGNVTPSDHGLTAGGTADLSGSYYDSNFLSFHLQPYLNQSRANSNFQSISDSSGFTGSASIFSGSHFPGAVSYSKAYNSEGNFGVPGLANFTTHGNSDVFSVGWGINVPDLPNIGLNFQTGNNDYQIYGTDSNSNSHFSSFSATASYMLAGFNMNGSYHHVNTSSLVPDVVGNLAPAKSDSSGDSFAFGVGHRLPFSGAISAGASRSNTSAEFTGGNYSGTIDTLNAGVAFAPVSQLSFGTNAQYNDNLAGTLFNTVLADGGVFQGNFQQASHSLDINNYVTYRVPVIHMSFSGNLEHRDQRVFGSDITADSVTGSANYSNSLLGGYVSANVGVTENRVSLKDENSLGVFTSVNYSRHIYRWNVTGGVNYSQNQQTLLITYTTAGYGYNGSIGRKIGRYSYYSITAAGAQNSLTSLKGTGTFNQSYSTALNLSRVATFSASYSKSNGNAILTGSGLTPTPIPLPIVTPSSVILYGGHAYSFGIGSSPIKRLLLSASYARAFSDTFNSSLASNNRTAMLTARFDYQFRQMHFQGGYTKLDQGFSLSNSPPTMLGSYFVGVSRWFNFF